MVWSLAYAFLCSGKVPPPEIASDLYNVVEQAENVDESAVPSASFVVRLGGSVSVLSNLMQVLMRQPDPLAPQNATGARAGDRPIFDAQDKY